MLGELILVFVLGVIPAAVEIFFNAVWPALFTGSISRPLLILGASAYYLMVWSFFITKFISYYLDVYMITSNRVLDIRQNGLFSRTVAELDLARVQDVTSEVKGILHSLLNYGNVYIQTAGEQEHFIFEDVHRPDDIRRRLLELVEADRKQQGSELLAGMEH